MSVAMGNFVDRRTGILNFHFKKERRSYVEISQWQKRRLEGRRETWNYQLP